MDTILQYQFFVLGAIMIAGFAVLGWMILRLYTRVKKVSGGMDPTGNSAADLLQRTMRLEAAMEEMEPRMRATEAAAATSVQKVGFLRFNPFQDTGGDNSFSVALLDREDNGVLLSSLYMREGTRLYAKEVKGGMTRTPLSEEEEKVLKDAMDNHVVHA